MKKLMIAAAIVCAAVMAQANSIKWGSYGVVTDWDGDETYTMADNFAIYLFSADTLISTDPDVKLTSNYLINQMKTGEFSGLDYALGHDIVSDGAFEPSTIDTSIAAKSPVNYFALLFDNSDAEKAGYVFATQVYNETMPDTGTLYLDYDGDGNIFALGYETKENWTAVGAVPEPTSGLLLLIGVAGLALRRRRA